VAKRLSQEVTANLTEVAGETFTTMVSVGVAQWAPDESIDALLARADAALYRAKSDDAGGGRVVVAEAVPTSP
jgi:PleD family two-component response regulator